MASLPWPARGSPPCLACGDPGAAGAAAACPHEAEARQPHARTRPRRGSRVPVSWRCAQARIVRSASPRPAAPSPRPNAAPLPLIWMRMPFCTQKARPLPRSSSQAPRLPGLLSTPDFRPRTTCVQNGFFVQLGPDSAQHTARRREPPISHARSQGTPHCTPAHALPAVAEQALQQSRRKAPLAVGRHCPTRFDRRTARPKRRHQIRAWL